MMRTRATKSPSTVATEEGPGVRVKTPRAPDYSGALFVLVDFRRYADSA